MSAYEHTCPTCSAPPTKACMNLVTNKPMAKAHNARSLLAKTPAERVLALVAAESEVEVIGSMEPADAAVYLRDHASFLDSGGWVPARAERLREFADRIEVAR